MNVLKASVLERRRSLSWWTAGIVAFVVFTVAFYPTIKGQASFAQVFDDLPRSIRAFVGAQEGVPITSAPGYLHTRIFSTFLPVLLLVFGIGLGARAIGGSEEDGTLELLLTKPITRPHVLVERFLAVLALLVALTVVFALTLCALAPVFDLTEGTSFGRIIAASVSISCMAMLHASIAFAVGSAIGRRSLAVGVAGAIAVSGYLVNGLASLSDAARPLRFVSPWHWALSGNPLVEGVSGEAFLVPLLLSAVVLAVGGRMFVSRDLN